MKTFFLVVILSALSACMSLPPPPGISIASPSAEAPKEEMATEAPKEKETPKPTLYPGTGVFVKEIEAKTPSLPKGEVTLNFENADIREVVKVILGDMLKENYAIDPKVRGMVTVQTSHPLPKKALLPVLEVLLGMNGAALVKNQTGYRILPRQAALKGALTPRIRSPLPPGYGVRIFPLQYIGVKAMQKLLEPFVSQENIVGADPLRNLLMLAGSREELENLGNIVAMFDVDWLKGMSVGLFPIESVEVKTLAEEIEKLTGGKEGPLAGMVRVIPIERLNALLVVTPRPHYLKEVSTWIERLDRTGEGGEEARLYVYEVQNGKAAHLAEVLDQILAGRKKGKKAPPTLAPGRKPAEIKTQAKKKAGPQPKGPSPGTVAAGSEMRIVADEDNNALLILATPSDYRRIEAAIKKLDVPPRQVLIEATIAEVSLSGELQYGLQWFFRNHVGKYGGTGSLDLGTQVSLDDVLGSGFSYAITDGAGIVHALLDTLASQSKAKILSSPYLMVVDNGTAQIKVGDQVPVLSSTTTTEGGVVTQSIQFRDTGVLLEVSPRVNAGGLVTLEITQQVIDVGEIEPTTNQRRFLNRNLKSVVVVQSGQSIILGGLIKDNRSTGKGGVPGLYQLPVVGNLFGNTIKSVKRTELVVLLTPRVVKNQVEVKAVTEEISAKLQGLKDMLR